MSEDIAQVGVGTRDGGWGPFVCAREWVILGVGVLSALLLVPLDGVLSGAIVSFREERLGGDVVRELAAVGQYGQLTISLVIAAAIWLLDPPARRRLLDWGLAIGAASLIGKFFKMAIGRGRPGLDLGPDVVLGPFGAMPFPEREPPGVWHAWEFWGPISTDLWSMPSSHTLAAAVSSVFLARVYPRLTPLVVGLAVAVGMSRIVFGAHWPSDVAVGGALGWAVGSAVTRGYLGTRSLDWVWVRFVDRGATPAAAGLKAQFDARRRGP